MKLYHELRRLMNATDYTQEQLARELSLTLDRTLNRGSIGHRLNGITPFTLDEAYVAVIGRSAGS